MIAYKFLRAGAIAPFAGVAWPAPAGGAPGEWLQAGGAGRACDRRVHACRLQDLPEWMDAELWRVELDGDVAVDCGKLVADRGRLLERIGAWDPGAAAEFAETCALRARDSALTVLARGDERAALAACGSAEQLVAAVGGAEFVGRSGRAAGYVGDAARHAIAARTQPAFAPTHAAVNGFIASHAAAFAAGDPGAAPRELARLADWLAARLALGP